jgi:hypothetical protein
MITAHLTYMGYYRAHKTDCIPLKDKHVYKVSSLEGAFHIPVAWDGNTVFARVNDVITEEQVQYAMDKAVRLIVI